MNDADRERTLIGGLGFPEEPRWREGRLWFIDTWTRSVRCVDESGGEFERFDLEFTLGGVGWLPDGTLVVVDVVGYRVVAIDGSAKRQRTYVDLSRLARLRTNGLCAGRDGTLYVASVGSALDTPGLRQSGNIIRVDPRGATEVVWDKDLLFPNGLALTPSQRHLIVAETFGQRVSVFDLREGASRSFVLAPKTYPDGVCAADDRGFWFADAARGQCLRADIGGDVIERLAFSRRCYAPALNATGSRLYVAVADGYLPEACARMNAAIVWREAAGAEPRTSSN